MAKLKSPKNKTIDFDMEEGKKYINRCLVLNDDIPLNIETLINKTILGDTFNLLKKIPSNSVDLLIADPPYNLSKNYHGNKFQKTNSDDYRYYTLEWLKECKRVMKPNASIYVCCDWESSVVIGEVLYEFFYVQNRINWQ